MGSKHRIDHDTVNSLTARLHGVLNETVKFLRCPLTADEMRCLWHMHIPAEIKAAHEMLTAYNYLRDGYGYASGTHHVAHFVIPDMMHKGGQLGIRMFLNGSERGDQEFMNLPRWEQGPLHVPLHKFGADMRRWLTTQQIKEALKDRAPDFFSWAHNAGLVSEAHLEAIKTIEDILQYASTVGQIKRMVPEIVQYCTPAQKKLIEEQVRRSPFPPEWAAYDKTRVQRLLDALAKGHLVSGLGKVEASGGEFTWAQYAEMDGSI